METRDFSIPDALALLLCSQVSPTVCSRGRALRAQGNSVLHMFFAWSMWTTIFSRGWGGGGGGALSSRSERTPSW